MKIDLAAGLALDARAFQRQRARMDTSWTPEALEVWSRACEHHGGMARWRALTCIRLKTESLSGALPRLKGAGRTFSLPPLIEVDPVQRRARFQSYPDDDHLGVFENGAVRIERRDDGSVVTSSTDHRATFRGLHKLRRWRPIDALYFFGYAVAHYHALPFTLVDARLLSATVTVQGGKRLDVLDVVFPPDLPTHCRRQRFYIDESGRIDRHDYHAEVVGFWARGAHVWKRETFCNGLSVALERHVFARAGSLFPTTWRRLR